MRITRRSQHRLDLCLAQGSLTEVNTRALVLGLFREVTPDGPAAALDDRLGGAIREFTSRRMFNGDIGQIFLLPTGRHPVAADFVLFAGLGTFDHFGASTLESVAESVIRTLIRTDVEDFATVLMGGRTGPSVGVLLEHLLRGFVRGLLDADVRRLFRRITFCELDPDRVAEMRRELYRLVATPLFASLEVTFDERQLPSAPDLPSPSRQAPTGIATESPAYLIVRLEQRKRTAARFRSSLLTAGSKAAVITGESEIPGSELNALFALLTPEQLAPPNLNRLGETLGHLTLAPNVRAALSSVRHLPLSVVHDDNASRLPWEALRLHGHAPALEAGLSRRYMANNLSVAKWLEQRRSHPTLDVLLIVNPTRDLPGAEIEGHRLQQLLSRQPSVRLTTRHGPEASRSAILADLDSGQFDIVHVASHAFFDPVHPAQSGLVCADGDILAGADLARLGSLPNLVFFNACETGRLRRSRSPTRAKSIEASMAAKVALAEALLRGGIAHFIGTYWPVGDEAAFAFAETFHDRLIRGHPIAAALLAGRHAIADRAHDSPDWADYLHYGNPHFALKSKEAPPSSLPQRLFPSPESTASCLRSLDGRPDLAPCAHRHPGLPS